MEQTLKAVGKEYLPDQASRKQRYYMRCCLCIGPNTTVQLFYKHLNALNCYLLYFPDDSPRQLNKEDIAEILDCAILAEWHDTIVKANIDTFAKDLDETVSYLR